MVELTLSGVSKGPGKFAPAPKIKPRPGRGRPGAPAAAAAPATPPSIAATTQTSVLSSQNTSALPAEAPSQQTNDARFLPTPASIDSATQQTIIAPVVDPVVADSLELPTPPVTSPMAVIAPSQTEFISTGVESAPATITSAPIEASITPSTQSSAIPTANINISPNPTPAPIPVPLPVPVGAVITSNDTFDDFEEPEPLPIPAPSRIVGPPRIGSIIPTIGPTVNRQPIPIQGQNANEVSEPARIPIPRSNAPPKILSSSTATSIALPSRNAIATSTRRASLRHQAAVERNADTMSESGFDDPEEESELNEFTIAFASLGDLITHKFPAGKLSKVEELRQQQRKEARKRRGKREGSPSTTRGESPAPEREASPAPVNYSGPRLIMIDGKLQLDKESLVIKTGREDDEELEHIDEASNRHVTSASFSTKQRMARVRWTDEKTDRFYQGLSYFGTDFSMICLMFPELNRKQIKAKFNTEERMNGRRVTAALLRKQETPDDLAGEMKDRIRERVMKRKAKAQESDEDEELLAVKRSKSEAAATQNGEGSSLIAIKASQTAAEEEDEEEEDDSNELMQTEEQTRTLLAYQEPEEELGAPTAVEVSMPLPSRAITASSSSAVFRPKMGPKAIPRKRKTQSDLPTEATASPSSAASPSISEPSAAGEPTPAEATPAVVKVSRVRAVPTIGAGRK
ncbi:hypothetical protein PhCBS80983_g00473 [Powellomyces hirtus]|uniref:Transcription factor TFIIIB component B'' Myb domain-containing protein n=1 Tax=Powellomyces hirtus TaxID=109895 RepID=A0A507EGV6_9FUNG|nr:hypothetical protein PhCBS80983_g00473 [Powellomyces hirtus]